MSSATSPPLPGIPSSPEVAVARPEPASGRGDLARLCAAGFVAYGSYAICRAPLLPLFARELGAGPAAIGLVVGASTVTGILRQDAGRCAVRHPRASAPARGWRPRVRAHAIHLPRGFNARRANRAPSRARLRHGCVWSSSIGHGVRSGPTRPAGRLAWHLCHGSGRRSGDGPGAGRIPHRRGSIRPRVHRGGRHRTRGAADRRNVVAGPPGPRHGGTMAGIQSGPSGSAAPSSDSRDERRTRRAVRPQRRLERLSATLWT